MTILRWELSAAAVIAAVLLVRRFCGSRLRPAVRMLLWAAVAVRLLFPFEVGILPSGVPDIVQAVTAGPASESASERFTGNFPEDTAGAPAASPAQALLPAAETGNTSVLAEEPETLPAARVFAADILKAVWLGGMAVLFAQFAWSNGRLYRKLRRLRRHLPSSVSAPVYEVPGLEISFVFCGSIYLPEAVAADEQTRRYVLMHENAHIRHFDSLGVLLRNLLRIAHWINPLVWLAVRCWHEDAEYMADESAVAGLGEAEREEYGLTLIAQSCRSPESRTALSVALRMSENGKKLYERIRMMKPERHLARPVSALLAAMIILLTGFTFAGRRPDLMNGLERVAGGYVYRDGHLTARTDRLVIDADICLPDIREATVLSAGYRALEGDWKEAAAMLFGVSAEDLVFSETGEGGGFSSAATVGKDRATGILTEQSSFFYDDIPEEKKAQRQVLGDWLRLRQITDGIPCLQLYPDRITGIELPEELEGFSREEACRMFLERMAGFDLPFAKEPEAILAMDAGSLERMRSVCRDVFGESTPEYSRPYVREDDTYLLIWEFEYEGIPLISARARTADRMPGMIACPPFAGGTVAALVGRNGPVWVQTYGQVFRETGREDPAKIISLAEAVRVLENTFEEDDAKVVRTVADIRLCYVPFPENEKQAFELIPCYVFSCFEGSGKPDIWNVICVNALTGEILQITP